MKKNAPFRVFCSNRSSDSEKVDELFRDLKNSLPNLPVVNVSSEIPFSDDWQSTASSVIQGCDVFICIIGEDTYKSEPVNWEIMEAVKDSKPMIIAVLSEKCQKPRACTDLTIPVILWNSMKVAGIVGELLLPRTLFSKQVWKEGDPQMSAIIDQYKVMVQSWETLIERRQKVNTVYLSAVSAFLAGIGVLISAYDKIGILFCLLSIMLFTFLGAALSYNWRRTIQSYGTLSKAKAKIVSAIEEFMPAQLFDAEWKVLEAKRYKSTTETDTQTANFLLLLFLTIFLVALGVLIGNYIIG